MGALDAFLGFTRMIGGGLSSLYTARTVRWGNGFEVSTNTATGEATVNAASVVGIGALNGNLSGPVAGVTQLDLGTQLAATTDVSGEERFLRLGLAATVLPQWRTVVDIDFAAQPAATFATDNLYSIAGHTFMVLNTAGYYNPANPIALTATGLVLPCHSAGRTYSGVARTLPSIGWINNDTVTKSRPMRAAVRLVSASGAQVQLTFALESTVENDFIYARATLSAGATSISRLDYSRTIGGVSVTSFDTSGLTLPGGSRNVFGLAFPSGVDMMLPASLELSNSAGGWGSAERMLIMAHDARSGVRTYGGIVDNLSGGMLALAAQFDSLGTDRSVTIRALRVDSFY